MRVATYIDGFNLYYGMKDEGWRRYYWLDVVALSKRLLKPGQELATTHYFTARIKGASATQKRQGLYLEALETLADLEIHYGHYLAKLRTCQQCGTSWQIHEEKMTDVNIAVQLLADAHDHVFDCAVVLSGDSDLTPPIREILRRYPSKRVIVAFPPKRRSDQLRKAASAAFTIGRTTLQNSQLPDNITKPDGFTLARPNRWKAPTS